MRVSKKLRKTGIAVCMLTVVISCQKKEEVKEVVRPVRFQQVFATGGSRVRTFSGTAQSGQESKLSFKVAGTVRRIAVQVGDNVRAGKLIAELDPKDYELQVQEAEASLAQAQAQERNAKSNYDRVRALYENNNASPNDLDAARSGAESAKAQVSSIEKRLELAELQLTYTKLTAQMNGAIADVPVEVNENVGVGQTVAVLTSGTNLEVSVGIPEILISQIKEGIKVTVAFDAITGSKIPGTVTEVGVATLGNASTYPVTVKLDEQSSDIRSGMAAEVAFMFETDDNSRERIMVPPVSVGEDREGRFAYVVNPTDDGFGITERRAVTVGDLTEDGLEIIDGLQDGELLVTAGVNRIEDGLRVRLLGYVEEE